MPVSERKLIEQIRRSVHGGASVVTGIGDDCAVLRVPSGNELLVTTDFSIENVHFRRDWPAELVGWRCLARGLSDVAAMGGEPLAAFLSLAIAKDVPQKRVDGFLKGLLDLANEFDVPLAGGDTAQSTAGVQADIVVVGSVPKGEAIRRSGATPGDRIYVTGYLGAAADAISKLKQSEAGAAKRISAQLLRPLRPVPRIAVGRWLRQRGIASAMIDISDGLSTDLSHICEESRVGAEIEAGAIPRAQVGTKKTPVALELALHGGDDYELLFTAAPSVVVPAKVAGVPVTPIGKITKSRGMRLQTDGRRLRLEARGWEHFRGEK
jgi:thiamine-monophosphate kinase